ncbi:hypothetical protein PINS_up020405 [Pythium insidiosum]|nr:hypothetical protein PINS_up020405 [Pythium insidiosum]
MTSAGDLLSAIADRGARGRGRGALQGAHGHRDATLRVPRPRVRPPAPAPSAAARVPSDSRRFDPLPHGSTGHARRVFSVPSGWHRSAVGPCTKGHQLIAAVQEFLQRSQSPSAARLDAEQLADALVLCGFVAPVKERPSDDDEQSTTTRLVHDAEEYELVFPAWLRVYGTRQRVEESHGGVDVERLKRERKQVSVWAVADGATRAGFVFRKQPPSTLRSWLSAVSSCGLGLGLGRERQELRRGHQDGRTRVAVHL